MTNPVIRPSLLVLLALCTLGAWSAGQEESCADGEAAPALGSSQLQHRSPASKQESEEEELDDEENMWKHMDEDVEEEEASPPVATATVGSGRALFSNETRTHEGLGAPSPAELRTLLEGLSPEQRRAWQRINGSGAWDPVANLNEAAGSWNFEAKIGFAHQDTYQPQSLFRRWSYEWDRVHFKGPGATFGLDTDRNDAGAVGGGVSYKKHVKTETVIVKSDDPKEFLKAVADAKDGDIIFIEGHVHLKLSTTVAINKKITLASDRGLQGSIWDVSPGALLDFSGTPFAGTSPRSGLKVNQQARITGLRVKGNLRKDREWEGDGKPGPRSVGVWLNAPAEIDNCEIFAFSHSCVLLNYRAHMGFSLVHHSHLHSTQFSGLGYGVSTRYAPVRVEFCQFERNRHAIASSGTDSAVWEAHHNIMLSPPGQTQLSSVVNMCGPKGRYFRLWSSFIESSWYFKIRGVTADKSWVKLNFLPGAEDGSDWKRYRGMDCNVYKSGLTKTCSSHVLASQSRDLPGDVQVGSVTI